MRQSHFRSYFRPLVCFFIFVFLVTTGGLCQGGTQEARQSFRSVDLEVWGIFDEIDVYQDIFDAYSLSHPNISVNYRKFRFDEYEAELLNALAEDRGPDIFMMHNTWIGKYLPKLEQSPSELTLAYKVTEGTIRKETYIELRTTRGVTPNDVISNFVDQVPKDVVRTYFNPNEEQEPPPGVYALPLSLDTLVLFYNKDILNNAGIPQPPRSWSEFQEHVKKIVRLDSEGNIVLAGAALGTAQNVERANDIVSLLMMQNGTQMADGELVTFHEKPRELRDRVFPPGVEALRFYTDFASPIKEVYTWDDSMPNSLEAFAAGKVGYFFGYSYHIPLIRTQSPKLNFAIDKVPQIAGNREVNFANYFVFGVSNKSDAIVEAWDFLKFASLDREAVKTYLDAAGKPTALRDLITAQSEDLDLQPFVEQVLTAESWYQGNQPLVADDVMLDLVDGALRGDIILTTLISDAATRVQQTMRRNFQ